MLLEGETCKLPTPKNLFSTDICIDSSNDVAIFATSIEPIKYKGSYQTLDNREDAMMASRWKVFNFFHEIKEEDQIKCHACPRCFAEWVLH